MRVSLINIFKFNFARVNKANLKNKPKQEPSTEFINKGE